MGDVNSMQEFLETSVLSVGDIVLLFGIVGVLLWLDFRCSACSRMSDHAGPVPRAASFWLPRAPRSAFMAAHHTNSVGQRRAGRRRSTACAPCRAIDRQQVNFGLFDDKARMPTSRTHLTAAA
jgi:ATP-binding cassette subfamily B multidrug efflux pump